MPVAYTTGLSAAAPTDFNKTLATVAEQQERRAAQQKAIMDQMQARQKAADKMLSEVKGYDVSKLMPQARPLFEEYVNEQMQDIYNFSIDDPLKSRQAVNNIGTFFSTYSGHYTDEAKEMKETHFSVGNDPAAAAEYDKDLEVYMQSAATPETAIEAQQVFDGKNIELSREGNKLFYRNRDPNTGEPVGEKSELTSWEMWQNPSAFLIPTKARYGQSPAQIGGGKILEAVKQSYPDEWNRDEAVKRSEALISSGSADKEATSARAWGAENLFGNSYKSDRDVLTAYITADVNNPIYNQNLDYFASIDKKIVDIMVENSKYAPKKQDESKLSSDERKQNNYLGSMRRETVNLQQALAIDVKDPTAGNNIASEFFGAKLQGLNETAVAYPLPKGLTLTNVDNPLFGATDEFNNVIEAGVNQIIEVKDVRKPMFIPASEEYPEGLMVLRDVSVEGVPQNLMIFDNSDQRDRTVVQQVIQEIAQNSGQTNLTFGTLANGWDMVQDITPEQTTQATGPFDPNAYTRAQ